MKQFFSVILMMLPFTFLNAQSIKAKQTNAGAQWQSFKKAAAGAWIKKEYLETLSRTQSPRQSQGTGANRVVYLIDPSMIKASQLEADGQTLHEGGLGFKIYRQPGAAPGSFKTDIRESEFSDVSYGEVSCVIAGADTSMVFNLYNKDKQLAGSTTYIKCGRETENAVDHKINEMLFSGSYHATDSAGKAMQCRLGKNGKLTGLGKFVSYYINSYILEEGEGPDEVIFTAGNGKKSFFAWEKKDNTILLYEELRSKQEVIKKGALKYTLVKD